MKNLDKLTPTLKSLTAVLLAGLLLILGSWLTGPAYADGQEFEVPCNGSNNDLHLASNIRQANSNPGLDKLILTENCTYIIFKVYNDTNEQTGLSVITDDLIIEGNGATIERFDNRNIPRFRLLESEANLGHGSG